MKQQFSVSGMSCARCKEHVETAVRALSGVHQADVNLLQNMLTAVYDETLLSAGQICAAIARAGYQAQAISVGKTVPSVLSEATSLKRRFWGSVLFLVPLMMISMVHTWQVPAVFQAVLTVPVLWLNRRFFTNGFLQLVRRTPTMDSLVALGAGAAVVQSVWALVAGQNGLYFESAAMIVTLVTLGKWLEARAKSKTTRALSSLANLLPAQATLRRNGKEQTLPVTQIVPGDILLVRAGERMGADGKIITGSATADESMLTGESLPQEKHPGQFATAGTVLTSGYVEIKVEHTGADTVLSQLVALVEQAANSKAPIERMADRVSRIFVPVVMGLAVLTFFIWWLCGATTTFALSCAICVLVISCPCALGLATPTALMVGMGVGARRGILIKSASVLEQTRRVNVVVLDKTGTVTTGQMHVANVQPAPGVTKEELLSCALSLESLSAHPLSKALVKYGDSQQNLRIHPVCDFKEFPGLGVRAWHAEKQLSGGNLRAMKTWNISVPGGAKLVTVAAQQGQTVLFFASGTQYLGAVGLSDTINPTAQEAVTHLHQQGIKVLLLSGDNEPTAKHVAAQVGIHQVQAGVLPAQKQQVIADLQAAGNTVAMVGDGVNDAPSLAQADVGIAMGSGTEVAAQTAGVVLMRPDLREVATALLLSRATLRNIQENLFWAFFYNIICIPLAAGVFYPAFGWKLHPMFAAAAMSISSVCVVGNALRLNRFKPPFTDKERLGMHKILEIKGMMCGHCAAHVERALNAIPNVKAKVDLSAKTATVESASPVADAVLVKAVVDAGYEVTAIR